MVLKNRSNIRILRNNFKKLTENLQSQKNVVPLHRKHRGLEQLVARRAHNPEAGGSSPSPATTIKNGACHQAPFFVLVGTDSPC